MDRFFSGAIFRQKGRTGPVTGFQSSPCLVLKTCQRSCFLSKKPVLPSCLKLCPEKPVHQPVQILTQKPVPEPVFCKQVFKKYLPWEDESDLSPKNRLNLEITLLIVATKLEFLFLFCPFFLICSKLNCLHRLCLARVRENLVPRFVQLIDYTKNSRKILYFALELTAAGGNAS